jgi:hypothetical protein
VVSHRGGGSGGGGLLTLEPLIEVVRAGVENAGWTLSGLQKTTSHQFEGRWEGESTRSAYLFFHAEARAEDSSIDVYLDETSQGLTGNFALVVDLVPLAELGDPAEALRAFVALTGEALPPDRATPVTLRMRLEDRTADPGGAETEVRFKVRIPRKVVAAGAEEVLRLAGSAVAGFEKILSSSVLAAYLPSD